MTFTRMVTQAVGGAAVAAASVAVLAGDPAGATAERCEQHMTDVGFNEKEPAFRFVEAACEVGYESGLPDECEAKMRPAIDHHNEGAEPFILPLQGIIACDLAADHHE